MLLLTFNEWCGPGRNHPNPRYVVEYIKPVAFATRLTLREAIDRLADYQEKYRTHYTLAVSFSLLTVSTIEDTPGAVLGLVNVRLIEDLRTDFGQS